MARSIPNILITGTPGTGKSTLAMLVAQHGNFNYISVNDVAKSGQLYDSYDEVNECYVLDEDKIVDALEPHMALGGQVILDEARESYAEEIIHELPSNASDDLEKNVSRIIDWISLWRSSH